MSAYIAFAPCTSNRPGCVCIVDASGASLCTSIAHPRTSYAAPGESAAATRVASLPSHNAAKRAMLYIRRQLDAEDTNAEPAEARDRMVASQRLRFCAYCVWFVAEPMWNQFADANTAMRSAIRCAPGIERDAVAEPLLAAALRRRGVCKVDAQHFLFVE